MRFKQGTRRKPIEYEKDLVRHWNENKTFEKSVAQRPAENAYVFYDGPPFITGVPHHGTLLSSIIKDLIPRYWTMKGKRVERVWGWDCHGLPAEVFTEQKLGIKDKRDIGTKVSLEDYILTCRANMVQTGSLWEDTIDRVGRWVDFKGAYKTMDKDYMESVWWAFKTLYDKGKIYEGEKVLLYCTRDATPISKAEVAMDNSYQDVTDPSVYVKFKLVDRDAYMLAWTTTPWTLPSNSALAVNKDLTYAEVELDGERLILAEALLGSALTDERHQPLNYKVVQTMPGSELVGLSYVPLFDSTADLGDQAFKVWDANFVHAEEGTGVAHESPAYGEEDYALSKQMGFPWILDTDENGIYVSGPWQGQNVWETNKQIAKELHELGSVWKIDYITHSYPHCHRCHNRLMYRAHPSWFMDVDGQRTEMLEQNGNINWFPDHIKHGRFENTVESAPDWNLSRDRFWATAMPVWKGVDSDGKEHIKVIGSYAELKELSGEELEDYHRPWVDDITFTIHGVLYKRIDKVLDCWFESGSMPFAQFHYPFENVEKFEQNFPGDFVAEYVGQVRAWFYYLHAVNVGLFGKEAFKNVIVTGTLAGNDGRKMSKQFGNYTDPNELMDTFSADALRFLLSASPVLNGEDFALVEKDVADVQRKLAMVWNMYDFFTLYADVDGWEWDGVCVDPSQDLTNPLDQWIVSRLHETIHGVDSFLSQYDVPNATKLILPFIDDASNWYIRRSRKRFWKSDNDVDKATAYRTLHYVLVQLAKIMAPITPFMADELYRNLTNEESVHLIDWPEVGHVNELSLRNMAILRRLITIGLAVRAENGIKVRQPLSKLTLQKAYRELLSDDLTEILAEELNVKEVKFDESQFAADQSFLDNLLSDNFSQAYKLDLDLEITPVLKSEGVMRELVRQIQNARKQAGLQVDDRIELSLTTDNAEVLESIETHSETIQSETLSTISPVSDGFETEAKVENAKVKIVLRKS